MHSLSIYWPVEHAKCQSVMITGGGPAFKPDYWMGVFLLTSAVFGWRLNRNGSKNIITRRSLCVLVYLHRTSSPAALLDMEFPSLVTSALSAPALWSGCRASHASGESMLLGTGNRDCSYSSCWHRCNHYFLHHSHE